MAAPDGEFAAAIAGPGLSQGPSADGPSADYRAQTTTGLRQSENELSGSGSVTCPRAAGEIPAGSVAADSSRLPMTSLTRDRIRRVAQNADEILAFLADMNTLSPT